MYGDQGAGGVRAYPSLPLNRLRQLNLKLSLQVLLRMAPYLLPPLDDWLMFDLPMSTLLSFVLSLHQFKSSLTNATFPNLICITFSLKEGESSNLRQGTLHLPSVHSL